MTNLETAAIKLRYRLRVLGRSQFHDSTTDNPKSQHQQRVQLKLLRCNVAMLGPETELLRRDTS